MSNENLADLQAQKIQNIGGLFNRRVGDFLYIHREANPVWHVFNDQSGNSVVHGSDSTDVIIVINEESSKDLKERLTLYLQDLVGRHGETLHTEGVSRFFAVTIELPLSEYKNSEFIQVTIHTGSGCCYDQDQIAYEVMAALSGVPVYKALSPMFCYRNFVRLDNVDDTTDVRYEFTKQQILVNFGYRNDQGSVTVSKSKPNPSQTNSDLLKFSEEMYSILSEWVKALSGKEMSRDPRYHHSYEYEAHSLSGGQKYIHVLISSSADYLSFAINIPFFSHIDFGRIAFAKDVMERLSEVFPAE